MKVVDEIKDSEGKVYTEPPLPYGFQSFSVTREDLKNTTGILTKSGAEV